MAMTWTDYVNDTRDAAERYMQEEYQRDTLRDWEEVQAQLLEADSITGALSGSYTHDWDIAADNVTGVLYDVWALGELRDVYGWTLATLAQGPELLDVEIRQCALMSIMPDMLRYYIALRNNGPYYACPTCSVDTYGRPIDEMLLSRNSDGSYTCPRCGCTTSAPLEDGCWEVV